MLVWIDIWQKNHFGMYCYFHWFVLCQKFLQVTFMLGWRAKVNSAPNHLFSELLARELSTSTVFHMNFFYGYYIHDWSTVNVLNIQPNPQNKKYIPRIVQINLVGESSSKTVIPIGIRWMREKKKNSLNALTLNCMFKWTRRC